MRTRLDLRYAALLSLLAIMVFTGGQCNPSGNPPGDLNDGALTADISDGTSFISGGARAVVTSSTISIKATQDVQGLAKNEITLVVPYQSQVPYTVTLQSQPSTVVSYCENLNLTCTNYFARNSEGSSTITITQLTPTVKGTFSAHTVNYAVSDSVRDLSSGAFSAIRN